jgi:dihydroorotate dehydrogenase
MLVIAAKNYQFNLNKPVMAKISVDVPTEKMNSFVQAVISLGIDARGVIKKRYKKSLLQKKRLAASLKKISSSFILFDWEYFSNELEYE